MDHVESADALHEYVTTHCSPDTQRAYKIFYDNFIEDQLAISLAVKQTAVVVNDILSKYFKVEEVAV